MKYEKNEYLICLSMLVLFASKALSQNHGVEISARTSLLLRLFLVPTILVVVQIYHAFSIRQEFEQTLEHGRIPEKHRETAGLLKPRTELRKEDSFGACLMIKEDNSLLYEWLAYHYTVLPLRHVFVGSDEGNKQNPEDVLSRWVTAETGLEYWIVNATEFVNRHPQTGNQRKKYANEHEEAHHLFVHRQRSFITTCVEFMKAQGLRWVTFIDTDEFLVMNRINSNVENLTAREDVKTNQPSAIDATALNLRESLPPLHSNTTVMDTIQALRVIQDLSPCYTMPRLLYGALENVTCPEAADTISLSKSKFNYQEMSTLRFNQHARKGDFSKSKYGKVMIDISSLSNTTLSSTPRNIHRPYKPECRPGAVGNFAESIFYLNHYIGSWERYSSREDSRRNRDEWELRAHITTDSSCHHGVYRWFDRFLDLVGEERARFLLGVQDSLASTI